jgi:transposase
MARHRANELSKRLETIPGIGVITATAMVATVVDASAFKSGRHFAAWIGLVPRQNGTGGKVHLGKISKKGEPYLRRLLVLGATTVVRYARDKPELSPSPTSSRASFGPSCVAAEHSESGLSQSPEHVWF